VPPAIAGVLDDVDIAARPQPVDNAFDRRGIETDASSEMVLSAGPDFEQLGQCGKLRLGQIFNHIGHEDRGVTLHGDAQ